MELHLWPEITSFIWIKTWHDMNERYCLTHDSELQKTRCKITKQWSHLQMTQIRLPIYVLDSVPTFWEAGFKPYTHTHSILITVLCFKPRHHIAHFYVFNPSWSLLSMNAILQCHSVGHKPSADGHTAAQLRINAYLDLKGMARIISQKKRKMLSHLRGRLSP